MNIVIYFVPLITICCLTLPGTDGWRRRRSPSTTPTTTAQATYFEAIVTTTTTHETTTSQAIPESIAKINPITGTKTNLVKESQSIGLVGIVAPAVCVPVILLIVVGTVFCGMKSRRSQTSRESSPTQVVTSSTADRVNAAVDIQPKKQATGTTEDVLYKNATATANTSESIEMVDNILYVDEANFDARTGPDYDNDVYEMANDNYQHASVD